uniref:ditrans,polycis-polyprenyl diphosphate synthase [(2E,6E)-farnesyldiphosphate specific] n=1 Tax=Anopheles christyi TaxID=43041 RepID=A0A182K828_9DIPT
MKPDKVNEDDLPAPNHLVCLLWLLVHTVVTWIEQLMRLVKRCRKSLQHLRPFGTALESCRLMQSRQFVKQHLVPVSKVPKHLVVLLGPERPDYQRLAQFIFWSHAAGIEYVSFYDHNGTIKRNSEEIKRYVSDAPLEENDHIVWSERSSETAKNGRIPAGRGKRTLVSFLSPENGKQGLVSLSRSIGESVRRRDLYASDVSIEFLDNRLQASPGYVPDPDLAIYFGEVCSTYGLLPWQIRLTEFLPLSRRLQDSTEQHFVNCLLRFAKCEQRLGT